MAVTSRALVEFILLGPTNDRRQLQDSPILGDVWIAFATRPAASQDLLMSPYKGRSSGPVASLIARRVLDYEFRQRGREAAHVAYLQGIVAARLFFSELLALVVPTTGWWRDRRVEEALREYAKDTKTLRSRLDAILKWANAKHKDEQDRLARDLAKLPTLDRYVALSGLILWAGMRKQTRATSRQGIAEALRSLKSADQIVEALGKLFGDVLEAPRVETPQVWQISLNRASMPALEKSVPAVKGDAARTLFSVKCDEIAWAVIDSGIDGTHPVFKGADGKSRVVRSFDFSNIRRIVSLDNLRPKAPGFAARIAELIDGRPIGKADAVRMLTEMASDAEDDRPINWTLLEKFVEIDPATPPPSSHGTHVAGIIGGNAGEAVPKAFSDGMCPDIVLYDFRVIGSGSTLEDTEFAIIAALQYVRHLNESRSYTTIHGVNLSLSIPHDVRNFACGRTPICNECERLVESGVVVVAAAGNLGYHTFETKDGAYEGYAAFSITDPGNAESVITVGATHRSWPHTYGVSFFSSRGPTGDGRMKPDLVAPGERIHSAVPGNEWKELDGTSMAAPHVSGAAAMLMARYSELVGQPRRLKSLLCESATDLGRERSFQGSGMLDVLRAFQKV